ncbi:SRPBCC domain-containing protein [Gordonia sp. NPDC003425]
MNTVEKTFEKVAVEADPTVPIIRITRDFRATPAQLMKAHTDPDIFARWVGPDSLTNRVTAWDARNGGEWAYTASRGSGDEAEEFRFRGCFHTVGDDVIVQTFTWEGTPDQVALETLRFTDLGDGRTRLVAESLCDSFQARDGWLASGMETGLDEGYDALDRLVESGDVESGDVESGDVESGDAQ